LLLMIILLLRVDCNYFNGLGLRVPHYVVC